MKERKAKKFSTVFRKKRRIAGRCLPVILIGCILAAGCSEEIVMPGREESDHAETSYNDKSSDHTTTQVVNDPVWSSSSVETSIPAHEETSEPNYTINSNLSDTCDKVLAFGYDNENNYFELVANETEDYTGTKVEIGVIKNNEWSVPLTTDSPFIGDDGLLHHGSTVGSGSIYSSFRSDFLYIGCGCFYFEGSILNGNNGLGYDKRNLIDDHYYTPIYKFRDYNPNNRDDIMLLQGPSGTNIQILNTENMQITSLPIVFDYDNLNLFFAYSEGLFACLNSSHDIEAQGFYDLSGNKVIDLSQYQLAKCTYRQNALGGSSGPVQYLIFENGICSFNVMNDLKNTFRITIDKNGTVIDSEKTN